MRRIPIVALAVLVAACGTPTATDQSAVSSAEGSVETTAESIGDEVAETSIVETPIAEESADEGRSITVGGKGSAFDTPDRCVISLGISTRRSTVAKAGNAAAHAARALVATLQDAGISDSDIQMSEFNIGPYYGPYYDEPQKIAGYQADLGYRVAMSDTESVGEILGAVIEEGGDDVRAWGISFETDPDGLIDAARIDAWTDAEQRATALAELMGEQLGDVLDVHEKVLMTTPSGMSQGGEGDSASFEIPVSPGVAGVIVLLTVTYALAE